MQHPVMRPAKPKRNEEMIGIADKIAIGEEHELDQFEHRRGRFGGGRERRPLREVLRNVSPASYRIQHARPFMSVILTYFRKIRTGQAPARRLFFHYGPWFCDPRPAILGEPARPRISAKT